MKEYRQLLTQVQTKSPLVCHITNMVTMNDCANITLAIGGSPIMIDALDEVEEMVGISSALVLNIGTLNERTIPLMRKAGKAANQKGIPVILDPVGAGASNLRSSTAHQLIREVQISVINGNISEISSLAGIKAETKGVDASEKDLNRINEVKHEIRKFAAQTGSLIGVTGKTDIITDGRQMALIENGTAKLADLTGTGCMCTSLIASFHGAAPEEPYQATLAALLTMGIAGECADEKAGHIGNGSFRIALHDAVSTMTAEVIERKMKCYEE